MKLAGVAGGKHPLYKKGDPIPLDSEKKLLAQARQELSDKSEEGFKYLTTRAVMEGKIHVIAGRQTNPPEPDQFMGTVSITYRPLRLRDDRLFREKTAKVKIHCQDCKDDLGIPDVETLSFELLG